MSLLTKASLIATPTAYGDGVLNSVKPTNGDGDFDFARASAATRVNEQGLIEKERGNLLLQSNQFDTTWLNQLGGTITGGQSGYDGSNDAWLISKDTSTFRSVRQVISWSGVSTFSVYAKEGSLSDAALRMDTSAGAIQILFDLDTGTPTYSGGVLIDYGTENVGNGWWRLYITANVSSGTNVHIYADRDGTTAGNIYIQDAQLEQGLVATDYIETTTAAVYEGITNDIPRINYENGIGSFLLEPQRTNLETKSELFSTWIASSNVTRTVNYNESPEGVDNATRLQFTASGFLANTFLSGSTQYTLTCYAKRNDSGTQSVGFFVNGSGVVNSAWSLTSEWQRFTYTYTASVNGFAGIAASSGADVSVYGFQIEQAAFESTYIPSFGSSVTRVGETCNNAGNSDLFNDSEGVLYAEIEPLVNDASLRSISISDGTESNEIFLQFSNLTSRIECRVIVGGALQSQLLYVFPSSDEFLTMSKFALKYKVNDFSLWINGTEKVVDASGSVPSGNVLDLLKFERAVAGQQFYGKNKMVSTFTEALSDSELECLTSWSSFNRMATAQNYTIQ